MEIGFKSQKNAFWEALLITIIIFALGVIAGFVLENWRTSKIDVLYENSELKLLDIRVQSEIYSGNNFNCDSAIEENINFANRIYQEAKTLERYEKSQILSDKLKINHEKYDLLRTLLFINSIKIKNECNASYYNVVYFYKFSDKDPEVIAKEQVFSKLLSQLKENKGNSILLIPIAVDSGASSINLVLNTYNISDSELPVILINEKIKVGDVQTLEDLEKYFK